MIREYNGHKPQIHPTAFISEQTILIGRVTLAAHVSVWPGCVLRGDVEDILVGEGSNLQDAVLVHSNHHLPVIVGRGVTAGHGAILHGCTVGNNCLIGMGAILLDGVVVEDNCIIGAGALVTERTRIPAGSLVLGLPARVARPVTPDEIEKIKKSAAEYKELAAVHRTSRRAI
ncbi:MAG: gamma carbonic anhydrase family protein [Endomicrobiales bacterium]